MPELPDLQAFSKNLTKLFVGEKILKVEVPNAKKLNVAVKDINSSLKGKTLKEVRRDGKELYFDFGKDTVLSLHMMLRGQLHYFEGNHDKKFPIIELYFENGSGLVMTDFQGQAKPTLNPDTPEGIDALDKEVTVKVLKEKLASSRASIKNMLLDQHFIRGIGNAYADEILYEAGISPFSICNKIPEDKIKVLHQAIRTVLKDAEKEILKLNPDIISGEVREFLKVHNAKLKQTPAGEKIIVDTSGSRKTYYTDQQVLYK